MPVPPLPPEALYRRCDPAQFDFETTEGLDGEPVVIGQPRAVEAVRFGIGMRHDGYNIFAVGPAGLGRRALVRHFLEREAERRTPPSDWCYVNNFDEARRPRALPMPAGRGSAFRDDMARLIDEARAALEAAFESEDYQMRRQATEEEAREEEEKALKELQERARKRRIALLRAPAGFAFAPMKEGKDGEVLSPQEFQELPEEERKRIQEIIEQFQEELIRILRKAPRRMRELRERLRALNREVARYAVSESIDALRERYADLEAVRAYLDAVEKDIIDHVDAFLQARQTSDEGAQPDDSAAEDAGPLSMRRYRVNVIVDHGSSEGAPVIYEDNPHYKNLVGHIEHLARMGTLVTDFNLIEAGALHRANGGYLIVEARKVLAQPFAWEGLKRALFARKIRIETPGEATGLISTVTLEPEPIPLDVKVVLVGEPELYYLLQAYDPDFPELFKVMADFETDMDRTDGRERRYAEMLARLAHREGLRPLARDAVCRVIERGARLAGDAEKLTTHLQSLTDLLREADYWAGQDDGSAVIRASHVQRALDAQERRADRVRTRMQEQILRDTIYVSTDGAVTGQVNGLSVLQLGSFAFGKPSRITARVRLGSGEVIDIEREVELSGPIHSKGVLILAGFLGGRYARSRPLSLTASLVFEQSYGGIEGDSASCAELYALLSAIAELPLRQGLAVTGSVNQRGEVQPIGGVNEKIEGFFDVCRARGLTGEQGVLIPASNVKHLMLAPRVVEAVRDGRFHVYPVRTVDEGIELLTGMPAGERRPDGTYPEGTVNRRVMDHLAEMAAHRQAFLRADASSEDEV
ncbi:Lon protease family protein [Rhodocaloribacter sp.]